MAAYGADGTATNDGTAVQRNALVTATTLGRDSVLEAPQYLAVRESPTEGGDLKGRDRCVKDVAIRYPSSAPFYGNLKECVIFNSGIVKAVPDAGSRVEVLRAGFREIRSAVGFNAGGARQLATEVIIDTLDAEPAQLETYLRDVVAAARAERMPLLVDFDTISWSSARLDLWANDRNFELAGPSGDRTEPARIAWRNWGGQIRLGSAEEGTLQPPPNLHSRAFRQANREVLNRLLPILRDYSRSLRPDDQYLYGGVILGTEISIGVNAYHYPNGNKYIGQPVKCDPGLPWGVRDKEQVKCPHETVDCGGTLVTVNHGQCPPNFPRDLAGGMWQEGFRAASELNLPLGPGRTMTREVLDAIVRDYLSFLNHVVRVENDMPTNKIFSHVGGTWGGAQGPHSLGVARFASMIPGWSLYYAQAADPAQTLDPEVATPAHVVLPWATPEWNPDLQLVNSVDYWLAAFRATANYHNNRLLSVGNWESISRYPPALSGLHTALDDLNFGRSNSCVVVPRVALGMASFRDGVGLRMSTGAPGTASYLIGSNSRDINVDGRLATIDAVNAVVTGQASYRVSRRVTPYYLQLVTDGCVRGVDRHASRTYSPVYTIGRGLPRSKRAYSAGNPRIYARVQSTGEVTLAWELSPALSASTAVYFNIATNPSFSPIDVHNERVDGYQTVTRSGFRPGTTYYARVVHADSAAGVAYSNTLAFAVRATRAP